MLLDWVFRYNEDPPYIEMRFSGAMTQDDLNRLAVERLAEMRKRDCYRLFFDFSDIASVLNTLETYDRPEQSERMGVPKVSISVSLVPARFLDEFKFMETVYRNRGYELMVFTGRADALRALGHSP
jgi:hypothetical protein